MKKTVRAALLLAIMPFAAMAGFVDETAQPAVAPAAAGAAMGGLALSMSYQSPLWDKPIAPQSGPVPIAKAIALLLPPDLPGVTMASDTLLESAMVTWDTGLTRRQALQSIIPAGRSLSIQDGVARFLAVPTASTQAPLPGAAPVMVAAAPQPIYMANVADKTVRQVIGRWARTAGWAFEDGYWDLSRDVPVVATAGFTTDFKGSVSALLRTTEVTDLPAKPCFYTNRVVRVVSRSEKCDKTKE